MFLFFLLNGQTTFNKRILHGYETTIYTGLEVTDSCYYITGIFNDTIPPYIGGNIFTKISLSGEVESSTFYLDTLKDFLSWHTSMIGTMDGCFAVNGNTSGDGMEAFLMKYDATGNIQFISTERNPFLPEETFISPRDFIETQDSGFLLLNNIAIPSPTNSGINLIKFDKWGNEVWQQVYNTSKWERPIELIADDDGGYLIGAWRTNLNEDNNNHISHSWIIKTDSIGEVVWEYLSPSSPFGQLEQGARGIIKTLDGGYVVASGWGFEKFVNSSSGRLLFDGYFFKLDSTLTKVWDVVIRGNAQTENDRYTRMVAVNDGSGYVACGSQQIIFDINGELVGGFQGWLTKISTEGDSLWNRYISFVDPDKNHTFYDLEETVDGGFLLCGEVKNLSAPVGEPVLAAWLVKVDEYGCVVPGCHLNTSVEEQAEIDIQLSLYPNPVSDYLNIYTRLPEQIQEAEFRIVDALGRIVLTADRNLQENSIHLQGNFSSGLYLIQLLDTNNNVIAVKKAINE